MLVGTGQECVKEEADVLSAKLIAGQNMRLLSTHFSVLERNEPFSG